MLRKIRTSNETFVMWNAFEAHAVCGNDSTNAECGNDTFSKYFSYIFQVRNSNWIQAKRGTGNSCFLDVRSSEVPEFEHKVWISKKRKMQYVEWKTRNAKEFRAALRSHVHSFQKSCSEIETYR